MKKTIINALYVLLMSAVLTLTGCKEPEVEVTPAFPEKVSAVVAAGESYEFTIDPNMAWSMRIPNEVATFFKFIVGESELYSLRGEAGTHTITVGVSNIEEFDVVRVCEIEMTMGDETKVVAQITRGGLERTLNIYVAEYDTQEDMFVTDEDGAWVYSTTPAERLDWVWNESNGQWLQRILVESNFEWFLSPETPAWLNTNAVTQGEAGRTELFLRVNREALPLEDVACNIEFGTISIDNSTDSKFEAIASYPTEMEGCKDVCEVDLASSLTFNSDGEYYQSSSDSYTEYAMGHFRSPRGAELVVLYKDANGNYSTTAASWMRLTMDDFPEEAGEVGVWERSFTLKVAKNKNTVSREGAIAAIPMPVAKSGNYNVEDYIVCAIYQEEYVEVVDLGPIYPNDEQILAAKNAKFTQLTQGSWPYSGDWGSIPHAYKLIYQSNDSSDDLIFNKPFARYEIYGFNQNTKYDLATCWLTIEPSAAHKELENGYVITSRLGEYMDESNTTKYTNPLAGDGGENEAFIFFYDENDEAYAFIYFVLDPTYSTPIIRPTGTVMFADDKDYTALGATLEEIVKGDKEYTDEMAGAGTLMYRLTLNANCTSATLYVPEYVMSYPYASWIYLNDGIGRVTVNIDTEMLPEITDDTTEFRSNITLYGENYVQAVQLTVVYKLQ